MITTDNNKRAIEAIKQGNTAYFHGSLSDYVIEALESLELPPTESELHLLHKEVSWVTACVPLDEMQEAIDEIFSDCLHESVAEEDEPLYQPNNRVTSFTLTDRHLNVLTSLAFCFALYVLYQVV